MCCYYCTSLCKKYSTSNIKHFVSTSVSAFLLHSSLICITCEKAVHLWRDWSMKIVKEICAQITREKVDHFWWVSVTTTGVSILRKLSYWRRHTVFESVYFLYDETNLYEKFWRRKGGGNFLYSRKNKRRKYVNDNSPIDSIMRHWNRK